MKTRKSIGKVISTVLAVCMLVSLFTCLSTLPANASASDTKMLHAFATATGLKFGWRSDSSSPLAKGTKYRLSLDWENVTNAPFGNSTFSIYCFSGAWRNIFNNSTYCSEWNVSSYALEHGNHYDIDFTLKSDLSECREFVVYFGDIGNSISNMEFNTANWVLYTRDANENLTNTGKTFTFPVTFRGASDGAMNSYINSYTASDRGQLWANNSSSSYTRSFVDIPSGYFDVATSPALADYTDVTSKVAYFTTGNTGTLRYYNTERTLAAGSYELGFDWKVLTGSGSYLKLIIDGITVSESNVGVGGTGGTASDVYDAAGFTRKVNFTLAADASDIEIIIGNSNSSTSAVVSGGYLKTVENNAVTGGNKIHNIGDANYTSTRNGTTANKWQPWASSAKYVTLRSTVSGLFTVSGPAARRSTFKSNQDWCVAQYEDYSPTLPAGDYKLVIDCRQFSATLLDVAVLLNGSSAGGTKQYDDVNRKMYYTFSVASTPSDSLKIRIGNYGNGGATASIGHVYLYATSGGEITGNSLIPDINAFTLDLTTSTTEHSQIWNTRGYNSNLIYFGDIPENYFASNETAVKMAHFPAGDDKYQVLAYKDADTFLAAGTYRLTVDINNIGTGTNPTVQLRSGTDIGTTYTGTLVDEDGFTKTYEFTVSSVARGVGVFLGNYGRGTDLDVYYKNPALYEYKNDAVSGYNYFEPLTERTYDRHNWTGSRADALSARWTPINCNSNVLNVTDVSADAFPGAVVTTGTPKMANFYYGGTWSVFEYNDTAVPLVKDQTYIFTASVKTTSGTPTVNLYDCYGGGNNSLNNSAYTSAYSDVTSGNTRTITFTMAKTVSNLRIRIGNYSDDTDVSASIANVRLIKQGTDANLIAGLSSDTIQTTQGNRKWWIKSTASGYQNAREAADIPTGYFEGTAPANMYYISGVTTAYSGLKKAAKVQANTTYVLEFDWKSYGGAYPKVSVSAKTDDFHSVTQTALANNTADGTAISLTDGNRPATLGTYGHYAVSFTTPADLSDSGWTNLSILFANYIHNDDYFHYGRGSVYYGNFVLKEQGTSANIILNGDLAIAKTGNVSSADNSTNFGGFEITIDKNNGTRDLYEELRVLPQPANFFTADGAAAAQVLIFDGGNWDVIQQGLMLESETTYELKYRASYVNGLGDCYVENFTGEGSAGVTTVSKSYTKATGTTVYRFTTAADLRDYFTNATVNFFVPTNGTDVKLTFSDVQLRKVTGGNATGPNLINNGGFNFGGAATIDDVSTARYGNSDAYLPYVQFTGWTVAGSGGFTLNNSISFAAITDNSFPVPTAFSDRFSAIRLATIGKRAGDASNLYEDVNNDTLVNVIDYVATKAAWVESNGGGNAAVDAKEAEFMSTYVNGNNATNLSELSLANMLAQAVTGTTYYVSASGSDSNNGTSPSTPWKTLSKAMTVTASGSAVLFKCGDTWRQSKTNASALTTNAGVTYGAYGEGAKPVIIGSIYNYATRTWTRDSGNIWKTSIKNTDSSVHSYDDVGIFVYDGEIGNMKDSKAELTQNGDYFNHAWNGSEGGDGYVYVYADANPATKWSDIEIGQKTSIITLSGNNVTINNLCVRYGGFGMEGSGRTNVAISNCEVNYIGGQYNSNSRLGNGIQFGQGGSNLRVKNCYVSNCFDSGITFQSWSDTVYNWSSINFSNNLITDCFMGIEWFAQATSNISNIYFTNNIIRNTGGWSYDERLGDPDKMGTYFCASLKVGQISYYENVSDFYIYDNTFDRSNGSLVFWVWNDLTDENPDYYYTDQLHVYRNNYYQTQSPEDGSTRLIDYADHRTPKGTPGYSRGTGESTGALQAAAELFDSNPGKVRFIVKDSYDRVIFPRG